MPQQRKRERPPALRACGNTSRLLHNEAAQSCGICGEYASYDVQAGNWIREHRGIYRLPNFPQNDRTESGLPSPHPGCAPPTAGFQREDRTSLLQSDNPASAGPRIFRHIQKKSEREGAPFCASTRIMAEATQAPIRRTEKEMKCRTDV